MPTKISPQPRQQFLDANGNPYAGAKLFTYAAGSTTKLPTFTDSASGTPNSNPILLDAAGRTPFGLWLTEGKTYKLVLAPSTDTDPPSSPIFTEDGVSGVNDTSTAAGQWSASGATPTYISTTQFSLAGDKTADFHVGRRVKFTVTAGTVYGRISVTAYTTLTTVTIVGGALDSGLSAVELSALTAVNHAIPVLVAADMTAIGIQPLASNLTSLSASGAVSPLALTLLDDTTQAAALTTIGAQLNATVALTGAYTVVAADRGKLFDCSGTFILATAAAATLGAGFSFAVRNSGTGVVTLDPDAAELVDGVATVTVQAGDSCLVACNGAAFTTVGRRPPGRLVQNLNLTTGALATGTTVIPIDDTIPQITEGDQYMSLAITPTNALSILEIDVYIQNMAASTGTSVTIALFRDAVANALSASHHVQSTADYGIESRILYRMTAGTTAEIIFRVRAGPGGAATVTFNGRLAARLFGGVSGSSITIKEYLP